MNLLIKGSSLIKKTVSLILIFVMLSLIPLMEIQEAHAATKKSCKASPSTAINILLRGMGTMYNIFPIRIGGIKIVNLSGVDDYNSAGSSPLCICKMPPPLFIRIGIKLSMWEAAHLVETVKNPWCSPSIGFQITVPFNEMVVGTESHLETHNNQAASAQIHVIIYPVWALVGLFVDVACFQYAKSFDYLYITEIDPLWQNDMWASLLGPEAYLVSNPVTQIVCAADAVAANIQRSIDPLFWCMGSWGSTYPMAKATTSSGYVQAQASLASRMVAKLHRELLLWGTIGPPTVSGWCQRYPLPMWMKRQYNLLLLHPVPQKKRMVIGKSGLLWSSAKNPPFKGDDFVWMLYNKRDCCLF